MYLQSVCFEIHYIKGKLEFAMQREKLTTLPYSQILCDVII